MNAPVEAMEEIVEEGGMTDTELVGICMAEIATSTGGKNLGKDTSRVDRALDYYFGRAPSLSPRKAKDPNASRFVSQDVMDGIEATVAEIMPSFAAEELGFYTPDDERDEEQAEKESAVVNYLFMEAWDGYTILQTALRDALLHRNCTGKAFWEEKITVEYEDFENVPEMALPQLLQPSQPDEEVEIVEQIIEQEADPAAALMLEEVQMNPQAAADITPDEMPLAQQLMQAAQNVYSIRVKRTRKWEKNNMDKENENIWDCNGVITWQ